MQNKSMAWLAKAGICAPTVVASLSGSLTPQAWRTQSTPYPVDVVLIHTLSTVRKASGEKAQSYVRLLEYIDGITLLHATPSAHLYRSVGAFAAKLDQVLPTLLRPFFIAVQFLISYGSCITSCAGMEGIQSSLRTYRACLGHPESDENEGVLAFPQGNGGSFPSDWYVHPDSVLALLFSDHAFYVTRTELVEKVFVQFEKEVLPLIHSLPSGAIHVSDHSIMIKITFGGVEWCSHRFHSVMAMPSIS